jgi:hypothetical protein
VNVEGKRPAKIEGDFPTKCASWATGESRPMARNGLLA